MSVAGKFNPALQFPLSKKTPLRLSEWYCVTPVTAIASDSLPLCWLTLHILAVCWRDALPTKLDATELLALSIAMPEKILPSWIVEGVATFSAAILSQEHAMHAPLIPQSLSWSWPPGKIIVALGARIIYIELRFFFVFQNFKNLIIKSIYSLCLSIK